MITLSINGEPQQAKEGILLKALLNELGLGEKPVVVELNRHALSPSQFESQALNDGDELEIITIAASNLGGSINTGNVVLVMAVVGPTLRAQPSL